MRPDIVLYNESHPSGDEISVQLEKDLAKKPDLLVVIGTSLKVTGIKALVKRVAKSIHQNDNGLVILVNKTPMTAVSEWKNVFDYEVVGCADLVLGTIQASMELHFSLGKKQAWTSPIYHSPSQLRIKDYFSTTTTSSNSNNKNMIKKAQKESKQVNNATITTATTATSKKNVDDNTTTPSTPSSKPRMAKRTKSAPLASPLVSSATAVADKENISLCRRDIFSAVIPKP